MLNSLKLLLVYAISSLLLAQENNEPFKDIEAQIENKIDRQVSPSTTLNRSVRKKQEKLSRILLLTYL